MNTEKSAKRVHFIIMAFLYVLGLIIVIVFFVGWYYIYGLSSQMSKIQTESKYLNKEASQLSDLELRYNKIAADRNMIFESIPKDKDVSSFIADVEQTAKKHGLNTTESVVGDQKTNSKASKQELSQLVPKGDYYILPIKFTFSGSYGNFVALVSDTSKLRRIASITGFDIKKNDANTNGLSDAITGTVNLNIFVKR
jgi:Tfp pilus assembly protein PilO